MQGLILAGGRGSRLAADGVETPKALVEVAGRPQIVHLAEMFADLGCESVSCMLRDGVTLARAGDLKVYPCRTPSSLHTLVAGLAVVPPGPVFCAMVDTVMPAADWRRLFRGVTESLTAGSLAVLAVTPFVDDELPLYVKRNSDGFAVDISDTPVQSGQERLLVTGGVYGLSPVARRLAAVAVASLHRMRAFLKLLVELRTPVATIEIPRIIDLDHKRDLDAAESWLAAQAEP
jgi:molybdopterin-guanine dinucleotide biosynthesis protein A